MNKPIPNPDTLAQVIANTLEALAPRLQDESLSMIALDCHPWHGSLYLAILKQSEVDTDPALADPEEMADWDLYDCGDGLAQWEAVVPLAEEMGRAYSDADDPAPIAEQCLRASAAALTHPAVQNVLKNFRLADGFRLSVAHPDSGQEYVV